MWPSSIGASPLSIIDIANAHGRLPHINALAGPLGWEGSMKPKRFTKSIVAAIRDNKILSLRAGKDPHRFIGIWAVVFESRVFVRSWSLKPRSWYRTFLVEPQGIIQVADRQIPVRAVRTRSERLKKAVSQAYLEKYSTRGSIKYARDLGRAKSRATTTELVPF
jgi:hypothetical protein